jgi:hypothetical protein
MAFSSSTLPFGLCWARLFAAGVALDVNDIELLVLRHPAGELELVVHQPRPRHRHSRREKRSVVRPGMIVGPEDPIDRARTYGSGNVR